MSVFLSSLVCPLPQNHSRTNIAGGNAGTAQTIVKMRDFASQGKRDFRIRTLVGQIIAVCAPKDYFGYAKAIFNWVQTNIKYAFDPVGVELIEAPYKVIESGIADCDSVVILLAAMFESVGLPSRFVTIKADTSRPNEFSHVYIQVKIPKHGWVSADATMNHAFGWEPAKHFDRKTWPATDSSAANDTSSDPFAGLDGSAGLNGLGAMYPVDQTYDRVPGVSSTVGVKVGKLWSWQNENALNPYNQEDMELSNLTDESNPVYGSPPDFFTADNAKETLMRKDAALYGKNLPMLTANGTLVQAQTGGFTMNNKWITYAAIGAAVWYFFLRRK